MAMKFEYMVSGDYAGRAVWEGEAAGWPVACIVSGYSSSRSASLPRGHWTGIDDMVAESDWFHAACTAVGAHGLCEVCGGDFDGYDEAAAFLEGALARIGEGEFDELLGKDAR